MSVPVLPFSLPGCTIDQVHFNDSRLVVEAHTIAHSVNCPRCHQPSDRVHSRDVRIIRDLPVSEWTVVVSLHVRRFFCRQPTCSQHTFVERLPELVPFRGQRTVRFTHRLVALARSAGGEAGARLAATSLLPTSPDTLLRVLRTTPSRVTQTPRVLGVDDFALQKGRSYGTILVDLEQHQPVDVLPDRTAETFATWLREHPGVDVIARDRSYEYARGATLGAPCAVQVADRWHLLKNHREALERMLNRLHGDLSRLPLNAVAPPASLVPPATVATHRLRLLSATQERARQDVRQRRYERYQQVQALVNQKVPILHIAKQLGMSRTTVYQFADATVFPERAAQRLQSSILDPYLEYLQQRFTAGCTNASQLWRELQMQGYHGTRKPVARWVQAHRTEPAPTGPRKYRHGERVQAPPRVILTTGSPAKRAALPAPRRLVWLLLSAPSQLSEAEATTLAGLQHHAELTQAYVLAQQFQKMVRQRRVEELDDWLSACKESSVAELQSFAKGLGGEYASIRAALSEEWSSGQVEGQVTRLKLIKRQMYGRAKFDLLRQRVLQAA